MMNLTCGVIDLGERGEVIHGLQQQKLKFPLHADVLCHLCVLSDP